MILNSSLTDLCQYCETGIHLKKEIVTKLKDLEYGEINNFNVDEIRSNCIQSFLAFKKIRDHPGPYESLFFNIQIDKMEKFRTIVEQLY